MTSSSGRVALQNVFLQNHLFVGCVFLLLLYQSVDIGSYILDRDRSDGTFDIGGLQSYLKL